MKPVSFDTHASVKRLVGAGLPESQAEAVMGVIWDVWMSHRSDVREPASASASSAVGPAISLSQELQRTKWRLICCIVGTNAASVLVDLLFHKA